MRRRDTASRLSLMQSDIRLLAQTPGHLRAMVQGADVYEKRFHLQVAAGVREFLTGPEVSAEFLQRLNESTAPDPWRDGFAVVQVNANSVIGFCSFTGPPSEDGRVEIAYGIAPDYQRRGYATEAARALIAYAWASGKVATICAHTLPERNASTRVLERCGFTFSGEVTLPEDGVVWRWKLMRS